MANYVNWWLRSVVICTHHTCILNSGEVFNDGEEWMTPYTYIEFHPSKYKCVFLFEKNSVFEQLGYFDSSGIFTFGVGLTDKTLPFVWQACCTLYDITTRDRETNNEGTM